jgi:hypothetical protein
MVITVFSTGRWHSQPYYMRIGTYPFNRCSPVSCAERNVIAGLIDGAGLTLHDAIQRV